MQVTLRNFSAIWAVPMVLVATVGWAGLGCVRGSGAPADVVLITLDTMRADYLGAYGHEGGLTPHLDALAREGVLYTRAWSTSPWTLPAHASMFTGKYPTRHGADYASQRGVGARLNEVIPWVDSRFRANRLADDEVVMAEWLAAAGYATGAFVGGPWMAPAFGLLQGYQSHDAEMPGLAGRTGDEITDRAIEWLRTVPRDRPLHLLVNYFDPHAPYTPPPAFSPKPKVDNSGKMRDPPLRDRYAGEIRYMDHQIGRLFDALREVGRYEGALIIAVSDHGELFGEHALMLHGYWLYEELVRVALIVRLPHERRAGDVVDATVSIVDLLPIVADEVGFRLPEGLDAMAIGEREVAFAEFRRNPAVDEVRGRRVDRDADVAIRWPWKLIANSDGTSELYRIDTDPGETQPVADGSIEDSMRATLASVRSTLVAPEPMPAGPVVPTDVSDRLRDLGYLE